MQAALDLVRSQRVILSTALVGQKAAMFQGTTLERYDLSEPVNHKRLWGFVLIWLNRQEIKLRDKSKFTELRMRWKLVRLSHFSSLYNSIKRADFCNQSEPFNTQKQLWHKKRKESQSPVWTSNNVLMKTYRCRDAAFRKKYCFLLKSALSFIPAATEWTQIQFNGYTAT